MRPTRRAAGSSLRQRSEPGTPFHLPAAVKGSKILWPRPLRTPHNLPPTAPLHGQSILEVLRTKPLTAPAPGSDRRLSGEAHQVGSPLA
jgi:hypothetical protein